MQPIAMPELCRDTKAPSGGVDLGDLPEWDLTHLYPAMDAPELAADLERVGQLRAR